MNVDEKYASKVIDVAVQTLRNWRHQGKGPPYMKISRSVRYDLDDIKKYLEKRRVVPEKDRS